jgi:hypothetical protein
MPRLQTNFLRICLNSEFATLENELAAGTVKLKFLYQHRSH